MSGRGTSHPLLPTMPPVGTVIGTVTLRLRVGGLFEMDSDIQDRRILVEILRKTADALEGTHALPPGCVVIQGREAIPAGEFARRP